MRSSLVSPSKVASWESIAGAASFAFLALSVVHCGDSGPTFGDGYNQLADSGVSVTDSGKAVGQGKDGGKSGGKDAGGAGDDDAGGTGDDDAGGSGDDGGNVGQGDAGQGGDGGYVPQACTNPGNDDPGAYPQTDFNPQPPYIPNDTLVLTLDDGPDSTITAKVLDLLKARNVKATYFVNTENWGGPLSLITRMINEGHEIANHTVHHHHLGAGGGMDGIPHETTTAGIETELAGVETALGTLTNNAITRLTLVRAPFGEPYQAGSAADQALVYPVVAKHGVAINWNFDTQDTTTTDGNVVFTNFKNLVKTPGASGASWGIFLMHTVHQQDLDALPLILDYIQQNHFKLARVEDVLCWKFGKHSKDLVP